ncbi:MAG: B12-binding domain-containing radical SAM protein [Pirellulales bacterium]|nr:B12-binding domain-containing radical SAM protein [Pirellulales bacterium]
MSLVEHSEVLSIVDLPAPRSASVKLVTLIRPAQVSSTNSWTEALTPPLGLAYLAAVLEENGTKVQVIDAIAEGVDQHIEEDGYLFHGLTIEETVDQIDRHTDLIGVSCMFTQDWPWLRTLMRAIRARFPRTVIVVGGEHVTALPEFCLRDCPELDYCVLGEGEETLLELVNSLDDPDRLRQVAGLAFLERGRIVQTCSRKRIRAVDDLPFPAWHYFNMEVYLSTRNAHGVFRGRSMGILATRGCPYKCTFCSNPVMYGNLWMARSPSDVLDEIELYMAKYGARNIDFYDLTFILKKSWILEFCSEIERRGLNFTWQLPTGTRSEVIDDEVSRALYRTGCRNITYAPESGSPETLKRIKKQVDLGRLTKSIRSALAAGVRVKVNMVVGFPDDTRRDMVKSVLFAWKLAFLGVHDAAFFLFSPYPGSSLFDQLRAEGRIGELDDKYFRSLVAFMDMFSATDYCRNMSGRELRWWRVVGMASFFGLSYLVRPWRLVKLLKNLIANESDTVLEQRLGAILRRPEPIKFTQKAQLAPAQPVSV